MRKFEPYYKIAANTQILTSENEFRQDIDLRLHVLETAATAFGETANEARDHIVSSYDQQIAPRVEELVAILSQFNGNTNVIRDMVLALVRDGVSSSGDTLKKLLALISEKADLNHIHAPWAITGLGALLDNKANVNHGHDISNIAGLETSLSGKANASHGHNVSAIEGLGIAATKNTGNLANTVPLIDANGQLVTQKPAGVAGWGVVTKNVGISNESGVFFDASNNSFFDGRNSSGVLRTRWATDVNGHLLDGRPAYICRAWVRFNGIGAVAINGGGNVSSITDNGVGDYTVNFIVAMPDANYAVSGSGKFDSTNINSVVPNFGIRRSPNNPTPSSVRIHCGAEYSLDCEIVTVAIFC